MQIDILDILTKIEKEKHSGLFYTPSFYSGSSEAKCYYFSNPIEIITAKTVNQIEPALEKLQRNIQSGLTGFGFIAYETGYYFEETLRHLLPKSLPVPFLYFAFFNEKDIQVIDSSRISFDSAKGILKKTIGSHTGDFKLNVRKSEYIDSIERIKEYIEAGDTYQVNYTIKGKFRLTVSPKEFFIRAVFNQSSEYSAFINTGEKTIISTSPELFFEIENQQITTKPMKGTITKGINPDEEKKNIAALRNDMKNRAENIMIVDLLRNDIGKICELTSVKLKGKYEIKSYESLHQMISTVTGKLKNKNIAEIFGNIFPCGSITGAPKIRTMQIINELEKEPRGIYTGTVGMFTNEKSIFNVAIRTAVIDNETHRGEVGIGSGVVWDSIAEDEFEETKLKAEYMSKAPGYFELIESMLIENGEPFLLEYHIERLKKAATFFLFSFPEKMFREQLSFSLETRDASKKYKCRILVDKWGNLDIKFDEINDEIGEGNIIISDARINSRNRFQYFKTTNRALYDSELKKAMLNNFVDVIFLNEKDEVAEGARTNIIIHKNGYKYTPYSGTGILNGCYRQYLLDNKIVIEKKVVLDDLINADGISLINSVRKTIKVVDLFDYSLKKVATFPLSNH